MQDPFFLRCDEDRAGVVVPDFSMPIRCEAWGQEIEGDLNAAIHSERLAPSSAQWSPWREGKNALTLGISAAGNGASTKQKPKSIIAASFHPVLRQLS